MTGTTKKKRGKKKSSVLFGQKPHRKKKKKKKTRSLSNLRTPSFLMLLMIVCGAIYLGSQHLVDLWKSSVSASPDWKITLNVPEDEPLEKQLAEDVLVTARKFLGTGKRGDLSDAAVEIQKLSSFARVQFLKLAPDEVVLFLERRKPLMCIAADQMRYVTREGDVYGKVSPSAADGESSCPGPVLTGVFVDRNRFRLRQDQSIALKPIEQDLILEAIDLGLQLQTASLDAVSIEFSEHRGFAAQLKIPSNDINTLVELGRAPFANRIAKLGGIVASVAKEGRIAEKIELDYQGKAFIKYKKM